MEHHAQSIDDALIGGLSYKLKPGASYVTNHTSTSWGHVKKSDVPTIHECTINQPSRMRTDTYELTNTIWNNLHWNTNDGYTNDEILKMGNN